MRLRETIPAKRTLLLVGGGLEALHGLYRAREMGLSVVVSDRNAEAPCMRRADGRILASTYDADATAQAAAAWVAENGPIDGVLAIGADVPLTLAAVAGRLGLRGPSAETARLAADKLAMKERFREAGVPVPDFAEVASVADIRRELRRARALVIKPVDSRGSRGVVRVDTGTDLSWALQQALDNSPSRRAMVEDFLPGPQVSTESLAIGGRAYTAGFSDRNYEFLERYAPYFIENGGDLPSRLPADVQAEIRRTVARAALALGVEDGPVKGDIVVHEGRVYVIELAARLSGGFFCTLEIPISTGVDFVGCAVRQALGDPVDPAELTPRTAIPVAQRYKWVTPGRVSYMAGVEAARRLPGVRQVIPYVELGSSVGDAVNTTARTVMVLATGADAAEADANARRAVEAVTIHTTPHDAADAG